MAESPTSRALLIGVIERVRALANTSARHLIYSWAGDRMLAWDDVRDEFIWEGSLRDICILDTTIADWRSTWSMLEAPDLAVRFTIDGVQEVRPADVDRVFAQRLESTVLLAATVGDVQLNCHFFDELEVEFDLDPRQVVGQAQLDEVALFMRRLAAATGKPVVMTPENTHAAPFLRVVASGSAEYISSGGLFRELGELRNQHIRQKT